MFKDQMTEFTKWKTPFAKNETEESLAQWPEVSPAETNTMLNFLNALEESCWDDEGDNDAEEYNQGSRLINYSVRLLDAAWLNVNRPEVLETFGPSVTAVRTFAPDPKTKVPAGLAGFRTPFE